MIITVVALGCVIVLVNRVNDFRSPLTVNVVGVQPSGISDERGDDYQLVTLNVESQDHRPISLDWSQSEFEVALGDHWCKSGERLRVRYMGPSFKHEELILVPTGATSIRLHLKYGRWVEGFDRRFAHWTLEHFPGLFRVSWVGSKFGHLWEASDRRIFPPKRWREVTTQPISLQ